MRTGRGIPLINAVFDNGGLPAERHLAKVALRANLEHHLSGTRDRSQQFDAKVYDHNTLERHSVPITLFADRLSARVRIYKIWDLEPETEPGEFTIEP